MHHSRSSQLLKTTLWLAGLGFLLLLFPQISAAVAHNFNDVQGKWYEHFVDDLAQKNIINTERNRFNGEHMANRAEVATLLMKAGLGNLEDYDIPAQTPLKDVSGWYKDAAVAAFETEIMGYNEGENGNLTYEFRASDLIPREELAQVIFNALSGADRYSYQPHFENPYSDLEPNHWGYRAILWNWEKGYMRGYERYVDDKKVFGMGDHVQRSHMAKVIALSDNELKVAFEGKLAGTTIVKKGNQVATNDTPEDNEPPEDVCQTNCENEQEQQYINQGFSIYLDPETPEEFIVNPGDKDVEILKLDINSTKPLTAKVTDIRLFIEDENGNVPTSIYTDHLPVTTVESSNGSEYNLSTNVKWFVSPGDLIRLGIDKYARVLLADGDSTDGGIIVHSDDVLEGNLGLSIVNPYHFLENLSIEDSNGAIRYQAGPLAVENSNTPEPSGLLIVLDEDYDLNEDSELKIKLDISEHMPPGYRLRARVDYEDGYIEDALGNPLSLTNGMGVFGSWLSIESENHVSSDEVHISLNPNTPEGGIIHQGENDVELLKMDLVAGSNFSLDQITFKQNYAFPNPGSHEDFSSLNLYYGDQLISGPITVNSSDEANFNINPPLQFPSGISTLTLKGNVSQTTPYGNGSYFKILEENDVNTSLSEVFTSKIPADLGFYYGVKSNEFLVGLEDEVVEIENAAPSSSNILKGSSNVPLLNLEITPSYDTNIKKTNLHIVLADLNGNLPRMNNDTYNVLSVSEGQKTNEYTIQTNTNATMVTAADMIQIGDKFARTVSNNGNTNAAGGGLVVYSNESLMGLEGEVIKEVNPYYFLNNTVIKNAEDGTIIEGPISHFADSLDWIGTFTPGQELAVKTKYLTYDHLMNANETLELSIETDLNDDLPAGYRLHANTTFYSGSFVNNTFGHPIPIGHIEGSLVEGSWMNITHLTEMTD